MFDQYTRRKMWKTELSKVLTPENLQQSNANIKHLDELLQPRDDLSSGSGSDVSDLTDIFEEFHGNSFLRANADPNKKYLSKNEADWKTAEGFTDEFKKTMKATRNELKIEDSMFDEEDAINVVLNTEHAFKKPTDNIEEERIRIKKQHSRRSSILSEESTTWQMLLANSSPDFKVSPQIVHGLKEEVGHWLERPDISWKEVDQSRLKCESWFRDLNYCEHI